MMTLHLADLFSTRVEPPPSQRPARQAPAPPAARPAQPGKHGFWARLTMPSAQRRLAWGLVIAAMLVYAAELGFRALMRYWTFRATAFDLGNMDQVVWNTLHGHFFEFTNRGWDYYGPPTRLAVHVEPILLPISLLYLIHAGPETLLIFQTLALTLGALPVFLLARRWLPRWPLVGVVLVLCYLTSPVLIGENLFDFHAVTLATPLLLAAVLAMDARRYGWFLLTAGLAALCKEDIGITVAILGLFIAFGKAHRTERAGRTAGFPTGRGGGRTAAVPGGRGGVLQWVGCTAAVPGGRGGVFQRALAGIRGHKRRWFGLTVAAVSFAWSLICFFVIIPHYLHSPQVGNNFWQRYAGLGNTPGEALLHLLTQPWLIFTAILTLGKLRYVFNLLMSSGLIGLLAPLALLPALPELGINLLSNKPDQYSGVYHYNAVLLAFLMVAAIQGTATIARRWEQDRDDWATRNRYGRMRLLLRGRALWHWVPLWGWWLTLKLGNAWAGVVRRISPRVGMALVCLVLLTSTGYTLLAAQGPLQEFASPFSVGAREARINRLLAMIPPDASVSASDTLNPHLSEREHLYLFPDLGSGDDLADYIVIDVDFLPYENRATALHTFNTLTASGQYRIIARAGSVYLARLQLPDSDPTG